jgi:hypothetical protein
MEPREGTRVISDLLDGRAYSFIIFYAVHVGLHLRALSNP